MRQCDESTRVPHACPVCNGFGTVSRPPHVAGDVLAWSSSSAGPYTCPACKGAGVLWEPRGGLSGCNYRWTECYGTLERYPGSDSAD